MVRNSLFFVRGKHTSFVICHVSWCGPEVFGGNALIFLPQAADIMRINQVQCSTCTKFKGTAICAYVKKGACAPRSEATILDLGLFCQVLGVLNWIDGLFNRKKSSQVGCVGRNHDECEEVPDSSHRPCWHGPGKRGTKAWKNAAKWHHTCQSAPAH